jgi:hypothetical protein
VPQCLSRRGQDHPGCLFADRTGDLSYSDTGQLTARSERGAKRASKADQDRIGLEVGLKSLNLLDAIKLASRRRRTALSDRPTRSAKTRAGVKLSTSPTALRPVKRIIRIASMAPDWAPADRPLDARTIALWEATAAGQDHSKAFAPTVFH